MERHWSRLTKDLWNHWTHESNQRIILDGLRSIGSQKSTIEQGHDYPAEGGLRPPPGVIEDMLAQNGITIPDDINVDWENIYNSINDPYYEEEL